MSTEISVFNLVTVLCEHELSRTRRKLKHTKRLRAKFFKTLLFTKASDVEYKNDEYWQPNCTSVESQYLTWQLHLHYTFKKPNLGRQLMDLYQTIQDKTIRLQPDDILYFLLRLHRAPQINLDNKEVLTFTDSRYRFYTDDDFKLAPMNHLSETFAEHGLDLSMRFSQYFIDDADSGLSSTNSSFLTASCSAPSFSGISESDLACPEFTLSDVWDTVSKLNFTSEVNWHTLGDQCPLPEKPFFAELQTPLVFKTIERVYSPSEVYIITKEEYMKHLQCLVVGIPSTTFPAKDYYFVLNRNVVFPGITRNALKACTQLLIKCGTCYKVLYDLVGRVSRTYDVYQYGYIYLEFLNGVKRYLSFYHASSLHFAVETNFYAYHKRFHNLAKSLFAITAMLKVGPYAEKHDSAIPTAVELLNYLNRNILTASSKHVRLTLLSIMFPCLQIYFMRFLRPWLFQGIVHDPHGEFFIQRRAGEHADLDRRYWSRAFRMQPELVPEVLDAFAPAVLDCGRVTHVLNLCLPKSAMCEYFQSRQPHLIQFCLTQQQFERVERYLEAYELKMHVAEGNTPFSLRTWLALRDDALLVFSKQLAAQRAATMKRIQQQRLKKLQKDEVEKRDKWRILREAYTQQLAFKKEQRLASIVQEIREEENLQAIREKSNKLIEEEAVRMIAHYDKLIETASTLNGKVSRHLEGHRSIYLDTRVECEDNSGDSAPSDYSDALELIEDEINANAEVPATEIVENQNMQSTLHQANAFSPSTVMKNLTEAQRNKLRVLREEYGETFSINSERDANCIRVMRSQLTFDYGTIDDNDTYLRKLEGNGNIVNNNTPSSGVLRQRVENVERRSENVRKSDAKNDEKVKNDEIIQNDDTVKNGESDEKGDNVKQKDEHVQGNEQPVGYVQENVVDINLNVNDQAVSMKIENDVELNVENVFPNDSDQGSFVTYLKSPNFELTKCYFATDIATRQGDMLMELDLPLVTAELDAIVPVEYVNNYIQRSLMAPMSVQTGVVQAALLRHFVVDLACLRHLEQMRNYFFLQDGEFTRHLTRDVFSYVHRMDIGLIQPGEFRALMFKLGNMLDSDQPISFCMKRLPTAGSLRDIDALDGLALEYFVKWPVNILIPQDALDKYNTIFQFLIKIHRVLWALKCIFEDLRLLKSRFRRHARIVTISQQYQRIQLYRHQMMHFIQTFQNYIVGEVLQSGWTDLQKELKEIISVEQLYELHANYVKQIAYLCFLNPKCEKMRKGVMNIFTIILKFFDYLRSREWEIVDVNFCHPNIDKLEDIYQNFLEHLTYFFHVGRKVTLSSNQPQFVQLMDMLDSNGFYEETFQESSVDFCEDDVTLMFSEFATNDIFSMYSDDLSLFGE